MKQLSELEREEERVGKVLSNMFGDSYGSVQYLLYDLLEFSQWANSVIEQAKTSGAYDSVMHQRDKEKLEEEKKENRRMHGLASVGIAVEYLNSIIDIRSEANKSEFGVSNSFYFDNTVRQAQSQLNDAVIRFLKTFEDQKIIASGTGSVKTNIQNHKENKYENQEPKEMRENTSYDKEISRVLETRETYNGYLFSLYSSKG